MGIRGKLFLAFSGMAVLTVLAGAVAWYAFDRVDQSTTNIVSDTVPAMALSLRLAEKSADIAATAPGLMASASQEEREAVLAKLNAGARDLAELVDDFSATGIDRRTIHELTNVYIAVVANLNELDAAVEQTLHTRSTRETAEAELAAAHARFLELLEPKIDDAVFDLVISSEDLTAQSTTAIADLVDDGVLKLRRLMTVSAETNLASGLMAEAANTSDPSFLEPLRERFEASARTIVRSLNELPDSGDKLALLQAANGLLRFGTGAESVFDLRERELRGRASAAEIDRLRLRREKLISDMKAAHQSMVEVMAPILDDATFELVISGERTTERSREAITELVDGGVNTLRLLLSIRAEGNRVAGLLMESSGTRERSMLQPLRERFTAAATHIARSLDQLAPSAADSGVEIASARLLAFGTGPRSFFDLRSAELEQAENARRLLQVNRQLATRLRDIVATLVATAGANSDTASTRSAEAIRGGRLLLLVIMALSVLGAVMIMVLYVMRRVVTPLRDMTRAMTEIAGGDTAVEIPAQEHSDEVGHMARALKVFRDTAIEVQETNLREIREARRRLVDAIESISEGFSLYDADDRLIVCNTQYHKILYPGMRDVVTPGTRFEAVLREAVERGHIEVGEADVDEWVATRVEQHRNPTGPHIQRRSNDRWIRVNERKTEDGGTVSVYTDISEDKRREAELRAAKEEAERALEQLTRAQESLVHAEKMASLGTLTAGIAHEIKNPLNFVNNFAESSVEILRELEEELKTPVEDDVRRDEVDDQIESLKAFLAKIAEHGQRADDIVKGMLSHSQDGSSELRTTDLNAFIDETLNLVLHGAGAESEGARASVEKSLDPQVGEVHIYPQEMSRVLVNLFSNSLYAMQKRQEERDDPDYRPTLSVSSRRVGDEVEVRIRDNGTGIPEKVRKQIFEPFFTTKPTNEGTGLGLSLSYETVVQQHHGRLDVESREGEFTEFVIVLPRVAAHAAPALATT